MVSIFCVGLPLIFPLMAAHCQLLHKCINTKMIKFKSSLSCYTLSS